MRIHVFNLACLALLFSGGCVGSVAETEDGGSSGSSGGTSSTNPCGGASSSCGFGGTSSSSQTNGSSGTSQSPSQSSSSSGSSSSNPNGSCPNCNSGFVCCPIPSGANECLTQMQCADAQSSSSSSSGGPSNSSSGSGGTSQSSSSSGGGCGGTADCICGEPTCQGGIWVCNGACSSSAGNSSSSSSSCGGTAACQCAAGCQCGSQCTDTGWACSVSCPSSNGGCGGTPPCSCPAGCQCASQCANGGWTCAVSCGGSSSSGGNSTAVNGSSSSSGGTQTSGGGCTVSQNGAPDSCGGGLVCLGVAPQSTTGTCQLPPEGYDCEPSVGCVAGDTCYAFGGGQTQCFQDCSTTSDCSQTYETCQQTGAGATGSLCIYETCTNFYGLCNVVGTDDGYCLPFSNPPYPDYGLCMAGAPVDAGLPASCTSFGRGGGLCPVGMFCYTDYLTTGTECQPFCGYTPVGSEQGPACASDEICVDDYGSLFGSCAPTCPVPDQASSCSKGDNCLVTGQAYSDGGPAFACEP